MVETQLRRRGIRDERVLRAMLEIPREEFVPAGIARARVPRRADPYRLRPDHFAAVHDGADGARCWSSPAARRCWRWAPAAGMRPRCWARWRARVISVEIIPGLVGTGARQSAAHAARRATSTVVQGDGSMGYARRRAVRRDLGGGRRSGSARRRCSSSLATPAGWRFRWATATIRNCASSGSSDGRIESRVATQCRFVPLRGGEGWN